MEVFSKLNKSLVTGFCFQLGFEVLFVTGGFKSLFDEEETLVGFELLIVHSIILQLLFNILVEYSMVHFNCDFTLKFCLGQKLIKLWVQFLVGIIIDHFSDHPWQITLHAI